MDVTRIYYWLILLNAVFFTLTVCLFIFLLREFGNLLKKLQDLELGPEKSLADIHAQASKTIDAVHTSADAIIHSAQLYKGDVEELFQEEYKSSLEAMKKKVEQEITRFAEDAIALFGKQDEALHAHLTGEYTQILKKLTTEILITQKTFTEDFVKRKQLVEHELQQYELSRIREIEQSIVSLVYEIAQKTIPDLIPQKQHEKIILDELKNALEEGKFHVITSTS